MAGQLRFVAHPTGSDVRMSFTGGTTTAMKHGPLAQADHAARQLLQAIAGSIERRGDRIGVEMAS